MVSVKKKQAKELKEWAKALADASGKKVDKVLTELTNELKTIIKKPFLKDFDDDQKVENALRILKATHTSPLVRSGRMFEMLIIDFSKARRVTPKDTNKEPYDRADVYGICVSIEDDAKESETEARYFSLALFDKSVKLIGSLERETTYQANVSGDIQQGMWSLSAIDGVTNFVEAEEQMDMSIEDALLELFKHVPVADAEFNICDKKKRGDLRMVRGNVTYSKVHTSESGYTYGRYVIIDDSLDIEDIKKHGGLSIMVDKSQLIYEEGSDLIFIGKIDKGDNDRIGMSAQAVHPIIPIPKEQAEELEEEEAEEELDPDEDVELSGDEDDVDDDEEEEAEEVDEEEEEKPKAKPKSKKSSKEKPTKKKSKKEDDDDDDDDDDGGAIDLGDDDD